MPEFLTLLPPGDALALLMKHIPDARCDPEWIRTAHALGRVTARGILSTEALPAFPRSTVDGYAVRAADTFGASDSLPAYLALAGEVPMGSAPGFTLQPGQTGLIHTGGMLPGGADAVIMLEHTQIVRSAEVEVLRAAAPGENVLHPGEDVEAGQEILPAGTRLRPPEIGGLMALGVLEVPAAPRPLVGILSSGDEVVPADHHPAPGQVRDVNSHSLAALVDAHGGLARSYGILPDRPEALRSALSMALVECSMVVITAGSSASSRDLTAETISTAGAPGVLVHGVNVKPGKPTILGVCGGKAVIGLPGNPVSALVIAGLFVIPVLERLLGLPTGKPRPGLTARLAVNVPSQAGREDYLPVRLVADPAEGGWRAEPIFYKSNLIFTLTRADGLLRIPADVNGLSAGEMVEITFL
jgi:molybdopterin molybdotransferase